MTHICSTEWEWGPHMPSLSTSFILCHAIIFTWCRFIKTTIYFFPLRISRSRVWYVMLGTDLSSFGRYSPWLQYLIFHFNSLASNSYGTLNTISQMKKGDSSSSSRQKKQLLSYELKLYWCICCWPKYSHELTNNSQLHGHWTHPSTHTRIANDELRQRDQLRMTLNQNDVQLLKFTGTHQTHFIRNWCFHFSRDLTKCLSNWPGISNTLYMSTKWTTISAFRRLIGLSSRHSVDFTRNMISEAKANVELWINSIERNEPRLTHKEFQMSKIIRSLVNEKKPDTLWKIHEISSNKFKIKH